VLAGAVAFASVLGGSAGAMAQQNNNQPKKKEGLTAPVPAPPRTPPSHLVGVIFCFLLGGLVVGVNFIPSKRGHQD
jgi:hypothetical protein